MSKNILITGASGMVGSIVLSHCIESSDITTVTSLVRKPTGMAHDKLNEIVIQDFSKLNPASSWIKDFDIVYYCLGAYTSGIDRETFRKVTVDYPEALANLLKEKASKLVWCHLSGTGADRSERSPFRFAKDKGTIENRLAKFNFSAFHSFRPAYIYPVKKRKEPNFGYVLTKMVYPIIKIAGSRGSIKSTQLGKAIFNVGIKGCPREVLENYHILLNVK